MTTQVAGLLTVFPMVLAFMLSWVVGDHRSGRYPLGPVLRTLGTALSVAGVLVVTAVVGSVIGVGLALGLAAMIG